jgi:hypothetical protein
VFRPADTPLSELVHDGRPFALSVPVLDDDTYEPNNSDGNATPLTLVNNTVSLQNLIWRNNDFYRFTVPPGGGSAAVRLRFWNAAADIDLMIYDGNGSLIAASSSSTEDEETVFLSVAPGEVYKFSAEQVDPGPAFY